MSFVWDPQHPRQTAHLGLINRGLGSIGITFSLDASMESGNGSLGSCWQYGSIMVLFKNSGGGSHGETTMKTIEIDK